MNKYEQMNNFEINKAVEQATGMYCEDYDGNYMPTLDVCNNPSDAFPIMLKYGISLHIDDEIFAYKGERYDCEGCIDGYEFICDVTQDGRNPLRVAMIVFLMMKEAEKESVNAL